MRTRFILNNFSAIGLGVPGPPWLRPWDREILTLALQGRFVEKWFGADVTRRGIAERYRHECVSVLQHRCRLGAPLA